MKPVDGNGLCRLPIDAFVMGDNLTTCHGLPYFNQHLRHGLVASKPLNPVLQHLGQK